MSTTARLVALLLLCVTGCGNLVDAGPPAGLTGLAVSEDGDPVVTVFVCSAEIDAVTIVRDREGLEDSEENPVVRTYTSERPLTGLVRLDLSEPAQGWTPGTATELEPGKGYIISATTVDGENETFQLNLRAADVAELDAGPVHVSEDIFSTSLTPLAPERFEADARDACA